MKEGIKFHHSSILNFILFFKKFDKLEQTKHIFENVLLSLHYNVDAHCLSMSYDGICQQNQLIISVFVDT